MRARETGIRDHATGRARRGAPAAVLGLALACGGGAERGGSEAPRTPQAADLRGAPEEPSQSLAAEPAGASGRGVTEAGAASRGATPSAGVPASRGGLDRIGEPAPAWGELEWIGSEPLALEDLRGRVVLIRFWTDTCPLCRATAPALAEIDAEYRDRGVTVIGMYHPKPRGSTRSVAEVAAARADFGWRFPVAVDTRWEVIDALWLAHGERDYTSASFVLDRRGVVRYVHPGGEFHPGGPADHETCRRDYADVRAALEALLAEPAEAARANG